MRWVAPETIHITLKFCGEIPLEMIEAVSGLIAGARLGGAFTLSVSGVGGFPSLESPRVIWTGISGEVRHLSALQRKIDSFAVRCGVQRDWKRYSPHITLGRRSVAGRLDRAFLESMKKSEIDLPEWAVREIIFMRSELTPKGPIYTPLKKFNI